MKTYTIIQTIFLVVLLIKAIAVNIMSGASPDNFELMVILILAIDVSLEFKLKDKKP